jgi:hypothetical protein
MQVVAGMVGLAIAGILVSSAAVGGQDSTASTAAPTGSAQGVKAKQSKLKRHAAAVAADSAASSGKPATDQLAGDKTTDKSGGDKATPADKASAATAPKIGSASAAQKTAATQKTTPAPQPTAAGSANALASAAPIRPQPSAAAMPPVCTLEDREQPRGGRLDVLGSEFGQSPVVRIAGRPARMIERRADRISVQVPADSDGGEVSLLHEGKSDGCGKLVIIGKNR